MSGVNLVVLMGRLGRDPEIKDIKGMQIANFSIATSKQWTDESGEKKEVTNWHNIVAFKKTAEIVGKYLAKGKQVHVTGELQTRSYEKDGVKKYVTEVIANRVELIGGPDKDLGTTPSTMSDEQIPF